MPRASGALLRVRHPVPATYATAPAAFSRDLSIGTQRAVDDDSEPLRRRRRTVARRAGQRWGWRCPQVHQAGGSGVPGTEQLQRRGPGVDDALAQSGNRCIAARWFGRPDHRSVHRQSSPSRPSGRPIILPGVRLRLLLVGVQNLRTECAVHDAREFPARFIASRTTPAHMP